MLKESQIRQGQIRLIVFFEGSSLLQRTTGTNNLINSLIAIKCYTVWNTQQKDSVYESKFDTKNTKQCSSLRTQAASLPIFRFSKGRVVAREPIGGPHHISRLITYSATNQTWLFSLTMQSFFWQWKQPIPAALLQTTGIEQNTGLTWNCSRVSAISFC